MPGTGMDERPGWWNSLIVYTEILDPIHTGLQLGISSATEYFVTAER
jgi:hypothetical protein